MSDKPTVRGAALGQHAVSFEGLLEAVPDALVGVDQAGVIRFVNHQTVATGNSYPSRGDCARIRLTHGRDRHSTGRC